MTLNSSLSFIDTHCHLNFDEFDRDRVQVVERAWENGIKRILNPGIDIETSKTAIKCSFDHPQVLPRWECIPIAV